MPAYNFKAQFAPLVESGDKRQTLRKPRKRLTRVGDVLKLYTGQRTKNCRLLREAICTRSRHVLIDRHITTQAWPTPYITIGGRVLTYYDALDLAQKDGFYQLEDMMKFFDDTYGLPVELELIEW